MLKAASTALPTLMQIENEVMKKKLDVIEQFREHLVLENLQVPGVVVIGSQSAGKSSVLEAICRIQLPRGDNTVARVPLILRLECNPAVEMPYAIIGHQPDLEKSGVRIELSKVSQAIILKP